MPQMSPMNWTFLMLSILMNLYTIMSMIHFNNSLTPHKNLINKNINNKWIWSW